MNKSPKLLILSSEFPPGPGGIGTHAYQMARHLHRMGWHVQVVSPQPYCTPVDQHHFNAAADFAIQSLPASPVRRLQAIWEAAMRFRPDLIIATGLRALMIAAMLKRVLRVPLAVVGHGTEFLVESRLHRWGVQQALGSAQLTVAVSQYTARLIKEVGFRPKHMIVVPNGADAQQFRPNLDTVPLREKYGINSQHILLTVGHVSERKAQDVVIEALPQLKSRYPDILYLIVGLPTRQAELTALAQRLGVADHVIFAGRVAQEELPRYYNLCNLFVLVSRRSRSGDVEGYGIVVVEAALCGKPAIVSQGSGLQEAVEDGVTGMTVPVDDVAATAGAIDQLFDDPTQYAAMATAAHDRAQHSSWAERLAIYHQHLQGVV